MRARDLLRGDVERIVIHPIREMAKPFARAEVIGTGKGLLDRVAFMVAGARSRGRAHGRRPARITIASSGSPLSRLPAAPARCRP